MGLAPYAGGLPYSVQTYGLGNVPYSPGIHPGTQFLPPRDLRKYSNLPTSIRSQIFDDENYDMFGIHGIAYDDYTFIDKPVGKAAEDYKLWLEQNPEIAKEIEGTILKNIADNGYKVVPTYLDHLGDIGTKDGKGGLVSYYDLNWDTSTFDTPTVWENPESQVDDDDVPDLVDIDEEKPKEENPKEKENPFKFNHKDWISLGSEKLDQNALVYKILEMIQNPEISNGQKLGVVLLAFA